MGTQKLSTEAFMWNLQKQEPQEEQDVELLTHQQPADARSDKKKDFSH